MGKVVATPINAGFISHPAGAERTGSPNMRLFKPVKCSNGVSKRMNDLFLINVMQNVKANIPQPQSCDNGYWFRLLILASCFILCSTCFILNPSAQVGGFSVRRSSAHEVITVKLINAFCLEMCSVTLWPSQQWRWNGNAKEELELESIWCLEAF